MLFIPFKLDKNQPKNQTFYFLQKEFLKFNYLIINGINSIFQDPGESDMPLNRIVLELLKHIHLPVPIHLCPHLYLHL
mgnify:CR=1 FL=1